MGLLDGARVRGAARLDARVRARGDLADRDRRARARPGRAAIASTRRCRSEVKERGLWAAHLPPELGGQGFGQVKLGLMHEILGTLAASHRTRSATRRRTRATARSSRWRARRAEAALPAPAARRRPEVGVLDDRARDRRIGPDAAADDAPCATGDDWVINGHKWFSTNASIADFLIVMAVTDPDARPHQRASMFIVPVDTPGVTDRARRPDDGAPERVLRQARQPRRDPLRGRARRRRRAARRSRGRLPDRPAPARPRAHPPLHALARRVAPRLRHALRARDLPLRVRRRARGQADGAELDRRLRRADAGGAADDAARRVEDGHPGRHRRRARTSR